jgi:hypothetical protein
MLIEAGYLPLVNNWRILRKRTNYLLYAQLDADSIDEIAFRVDYPVDKARYGLGSFNLAALEAGLYDGTQPDGSLHLQITERDEQHDPHIVSAGVVAETIAWARLFFILNRPLAVGSLGPRSRLSPLAAPSLERLTPAVTHVS